MAVGIREFSTPNYAQHIPGEDKEERPIQKIEKFATFLNELPWFPKGFFGSGNEETEASADALARNSEAGVTGDDVKAAVDKSITEDKDMGDIAKADANRDSFGVTPDMAVELQIMQNAKDNDEFAKALEAAEIKRLPISGELDQHNVLYKNNPENVKDYQKRFGMTDKDVDGIWGKKTQAAYDKYTGE
jgi:hypothetical protein